MPPPEPCRLQVPRLESTLEIERLYTDFANALINRSRRPLVIDLRSVKFLRPDAVMALISIARLWLQVVGEPTMVHLAGKPHSYLNRIDVFTVCSDFLRQSSEPAEKFLRTSSYNVLEVFQIPSEVQANKYISRQALRRALQILLNSPTVFPTLTQERVDTVSTLFSEIAYNVVHSQDEGFGLIQRYPELERVDVAIADLGVGIEGTLKNKYTFTRGSEYIYNAIELGITSRIGRGGMGLTRVRELVQNGGGLLTIRSNRSMVQIFEKESWLYDDLAPIPGVQIFLTAWGRPAAKDWEYRKVN